MRFHNPTEGAATLALRDGDTAAIGFYLDHGRVHEGELAAVTDELYHDWATDTADGHDAIMLAGPRDIVDELNGRARADRLAGLDPDTDPGPETRLSDGHHANAGDLVITRHNDSRYRSRPPTTSATATAGASRPCTPTAPCPWSTGAATAAHPARRLRQRACRTRLRLHHPHQPGPHHRHLPDPVHRHRIPRPGLRPPVARPPRKPRLHRHRAARRRTLRAHRGSATPRHRRRHLHPHARPRRQPEIRHHPRPGSPRPRPAPAAPPPTPTPTPSAPAPNTVAGPEAMARSTPPPPVIDAHRRAVDLTACAAWPVLRKHLATLAVADTDPVTALTDTRRARELGSAVDPAAVLDWRLDPAGAHHTAGSAAVAARRPRPPRRAPRLRPLPAGAAGNWSPTSPTMCATSPPNGPPPTRPAGRGPWSHDTATPPCSGPRRVARRHRRRRRRPPPHRPRPLPSSKPATSADYGDASATSLGDLDAPATRWAPLADPIDPRMARRPYWPVLAERLTLADRAGPTFRGCSRRVPPSAAARRHARRRTVVALSRPAPPRDALDPAPGRAPGPLRPDWVGTSTRLRLHVAARAHRRPRLARACRRHRVRRPAPWPPHALLDTAAHLLSDGRPTPRCGPPTSPPPPPCASPSRPPALPQATASCHPNP